MSRLNCNNLDVSIARVNVTSGLRLELSGGQFWGLLGANGVGKTTLLRCMAGLHEPSAGSVSLDNQPISDLPRRYLARQIGMLQQHSAYVFDSSVMEIALTGRHPHLGHWQRESRRDVEIARAALQSVGLGEFTERGVTGLSGGESRRLAVAALLVQQPKIMLLDEPTNHLDLQHQVAVMRLLKQQTLDESASAIAALHDINLAARYCTHVVMLFGDGAWCAGKSSEMLSESALERLYGCPIEKTRGEAGPYFHPVP